jgi:DNA repair exonuclease SbcCD ATPase subunit
MLRKNSPLPSKPALEPIEAPEAPKEKDAAAIIPETATADELGRLRDILFGSQSRSMEKRLADLEAELHATRQQMTDLINDRVAALSEATSAQATETRREFNEKLTRQGSEHAAQLRLAQKDLSERLDRQAAEQAAQLSAAYKALTEAIEKLAADSLRQIRETHRELSERIEKQGLEQAERLRSLQAETRQRDEALRQELLTLAATLEDKKASRQDLGQMLMELGFRLRQDSGNGS